MEAVPMENYLQVLEESLHKKLDVLRRIAEAGIRQEQILKQDPLDEEAFSESIEEKGELADELNRLDDGFESLYEHIREQLTVDKEKYRVQIAALQKLIVEVTEKSVSIQAQETRNKTLAERYFAGRKQELQKSRRSSKAAYDYYRSMSQSNMLQPQFMDKKK